jgi:hypothetical protein
MLWNHKYLDKRRKNQGTMSLKGKNVNENQAQVGFEPMTY